MANVFILSTGRCGSTTIARACGHFSNYTSGHETRTAKLGVDRFDYPDWHIESDNRLSWLLGRLEKHYGDGAYYLHLTRNKEDVARSYAKRIKFGIMRAYHKRGILMHLQEPDPFELACDYVDTVTANIESFLRDKPNKMSLRLEDAAQDFTKFVDWINAEGDIEAAIAEFSIRHNAS